MAACACFNSKVPVSEPTSEPTSKPPAYDQLTVSTASTMDKVSSIASTATDKVSVQKFEMTGGVLDKLEGSPGVLILAPDNYKTKLQGELPNGFTVRDGVLFMNTNYHMQGNYRRMDSGDGDTHFKDVRLALLLTPGIYEDLKIEVGYHSQVIGLGVTPQDVKVQVVGTSVFDSTGNHTNTFWRSIENVESLTSMNWWVSQGTSLRSIVVNGDLSLSSGGRDGMSGFASGGFLANASVTGHISPSNQQQWCSRNTDIQNGWNGWASIFNFEIGNTGAVDPNSPQLVKEVPIIAEKPILVFENGGLSIHVPPKRVNAVGPDFSSADKNDKFSVTADMLMFPSDSAKAIMNKLDRQSEQNGWKAILLLPGEYNNLNESIVVDVPYNVVVMGIGFATLIGHEFGPCLLTRDNGREMRIASFLFHQGDGTNKESLIEIGNGSVCSSASEIKICSGVFGHCSSTITKDDNRTVFFYDIFCRTGGPKSNLGCCDVMMQVNASGVVGDNSWLWTGDHGLANRNGQEYSAENNGMFVDWFANHGLVVEGNDFLQYGLMSEHHKGEMVWFKGENAEVFFYQSELPYAQFDTTKFAYFVDPSVKKHTCHAVGAYIIFTNYPLDKSKPDYDAGMSVGNSDDVVVNDLIVMQWHNTGTKAALKVGDQLLGQGSGWGHMHWLSHNGSAVNNFVSWMRRVAGRMKADVGGVSRFFSFCNAAQGVETASEVL